MNHAPLHGIKVVELSTYVAAPSCARLLADLGAKVIKVESFSGDPWRTRGKNIINRGDDENPVFDVYNIGKESICINIKQDAGMGCILNLLATSDVFITNTRSKSLKKLGLDAETLSIRFPKLIVATIEGFGPLGPDAESPGFDNVAFWTRSGFLRDMVVETEQGSYPVAPPTGCGDSVTGNALATGILAALYKRERTGKGDIVSVSLYNMAIWAMSSMIIRAQSKYGEHFPMQRGEMNPFSCQYKCADGEWFCITVLEYDRYASTVYELLGIADEVLALGISDYPSMQLNRSKLITLMERAFLERSLAEWLQIFKKADIVCGAMTHFKDVSEDEQAWINGYVKEQKFRNGETCVMPCPPIRLASQSASGIEMAPLLGEQTDTVLKRLGYTEEEIKELHHCGAVQ